MFLTNKVGRSEKNPLNLGKNNVHILFKTNETYVRDGTLAVNYELFSVFANSSSVEEQKHTILNFETSDTKLKLSCLKEQQEKQCCGAFGERTRNNYSTSCFPR